MISNIVLKPFRDETSFTESRMSEEELLRGLESLDPPERRED